MQKNYFINFMLFRKYVDTCKINMNKIYEYGKLKMKLFAFI